MPGRCAASGPCPAPTWPIRSLRSSPRTSVGVAGAEHLDLGAQLARRSAGPGPTPTSAVISVSSISSQVSRPAGRGRAGRAGPRPAPTATGPAGRAAGPAGPADGGGFSTPRPGAARRHGAARRRRRDRRRLGRGRRRVPQLGLAGRLRRRGDRRVAARRRRRADQQRRRAVSGARTARTMMRITYAMAAPVSQTDEPRPRRSRR